VVVVTIVSKFEIQEIYLCADKHRSATTLNPVLAHNLHTEFKGGFHEIIRYIEALLPQLKYTKL
jgi:hypothetical protein